MGIFSENSRPSKSRFSSGSNSWINYVVHDNLFSSKTDSGFNKCLSLNLLGFENITLSTYPGTEIFFPANFIIATLSNISLAIYRICGNVYETVWDCFHVVFSIEDHHQIIQYV